MQRAALRRCQDESFDGCRRTDKYMSFPVFRQRIPIGLDLRNLSPTSNGGLHLFQRPDETYVKRPAAALARSERPEVLRMTDRKRQCM